jgi:hypothetical protein
MTALLGWLLACALIAPQAGDDETTGRRESIRTRRLYDLIKEKVTTDARNTNLMETDDLTFLCMVFLVTSAELLTVNITSASLATA